MSLNIKKKEKTKSERNIKKKQRVQIVYEKELMKIKKIKSLQGEFKGLFRLRLRTYRIIYEKQNGKLIILVLRVSHRKDVYK